MPEHAVTTQRRTGCLRRWAVGLPWLAVAVGCGGEMPSVRLSREVRLPVPHSTLAGSGPSRLTRVLQGEVFRLAPLTLIPLAFNQQPDIRSSFHRFRSEESRYDFFVVSRDSLTPRLRASNRFSADRADETVVRGRDHSIEFALEKEFFDTTEVDVGVGLRVDATDEAIGYRPFVSGSLRYPLWVSRQKLERTSEDIFRRNELNDAQLGYIQEVRERLQSALFQFYRVLDLRRQRENAKAWRDELVALGDRLNEVQGRDLTADRQRVAAEATRAAAQVRELDGRSALELERLKAAIGIPFYTPLDLVDEPFNPFEGSTHQELLRISIDTDPEIATLRNERRNAEVQLDLARRGRWDVSLLASGVSDLEGAGEREGVSGWSASVGVDVSVVDPRVTTSLSRQAESRIARFGQAIIARENAIFADTFEPIIRIETLSESREELITNLPRFERDYRNGKADYRAGTLNIDDLLKRRETLFEQQQEISRLMMLVGANVAELCAATGRFFDLLEPAGVKSASVPESGS